MKTKVRLSRVFIAQLVAQSHDNLNQLSSPAIRHAIASRNPDLKWIKDPRITWLIGEKLKAAHKKRKRLLEFVLNNTRGNFDYYKISTGKLSPGCLICGNGGWSCVLFNIRCTRNCFYCPQDRGKKEEIPVSTRDIAFPSPGDYIKYIEKFNIRGVGFTGGEPFLEFERLRSYISTIHVRFAGKIHIWLYTNGDLVTSEKLRKLKRAGLNEVRFDISAAMYDLTKVAFAAKIIDTVTIEIPAIPEDLEILKKRLAEIQRIGVKFLNIHQLASSRYNYRNFIKRGYTFICQSRLPILESEISALKLMQYAVEKNIKVPINYCSQIYKAIFQGKDTRTQTACHVIKDFEELTTLGFIRRIALYGAPGDIERMAKALRSHRQSAKLWSLSDSESAIFIHSSLLRRFNPDGFSMGVSYFQTHLRESTGGTGDTQGIPLNPHRKLLVSRSVRDECGQMSIAAQRIFKKLYIDRLIEKMSAKELVDFVYRNYKDYPLEVQKGVSDIKEEIEFLISIKELEYQKPNPWEL